MADPGQYVPINKLGGQESRPPPTAVPRGKAAVAEGTFHNSDLLSSSLGSTKLSTTRIPGSAYELKGISTGVLQIDMPDRTRLWTHRNNINDDLDVSIGWGARFLSMGQLVQSAADDEGNFVFRSSCQRATPSLVNVGLTPSTEVRLKVTADAVGELVPAFGFSHNDEHTTFVPDDEAGETFDWDAWWWFTIHWRYRSASGASRVEFRGYQWSGTDRIGFTVSHDYGATEKVQWVIRRPMWGGITPPRRHHHGVLHPQHMLISEIRVGASLPQILGNPINSATGAWSRAVAGDLNGAGLIEVFPLSGTGTTFQGLGGTQGRIAGNSVHLLDDGPAGSARGLYFDGSAGVFLRDAARLREPPGSDLPGFYLERPELSVGIFINAPYRRTPQLAVNLDDNGTPGDYDRRACIMCWTTPLTRNYGVATDPYSAVSGPRPGEHLRVELVTDFLTKEMFFDVYFGELEPESLKHPAGTLGGSSSTAWPPTVSGEGLPAPAWNKPLVLPPSASGVAFRILIGLTTDATHPMDYDWHIVCQRKFVDQGDPGNLISAYAHRYVDGVFDETAFTDGDGEFHDATNEEKSFTNQSCYTSVRLGVIDINAETDAYAFSLGAACPGAFGDELGTEPFDKGWDDYSVPPGTERGLIPARGADTSFSISNYMEGYPFVGGLAHFYAITRYLRRDERLIIARAGKIGLAEQRHFGTDLIYHLPMTDKGNILREYGGADIDHDDPSARAYVINELTTEVGDPEFVSFYPVAEPDWHNEGPPFPEESSPVTGVIQRIDEAGSERLFITAVTGLYEYDRTARSITRLLTMPGQGGPRRISWALDQNDVIHIVGGPGRPIIITRSDVIGFSGMFGPSYSAPAGLITQPASITGGFGITFQSKGDTNLDNLARFEIPNQGVIGFCIGYYSEVLRTRSAPGPVIHVRYSDPATGTQPTGTAPTYRYRLKLTGTLPLPVGFNASLITHWEIFRTTANNEVLKLELRIPISGSPPELFIGWRPDFELGEEANFFTYPPQAGMKHISMIGPRMIGVGSNDEPRQISHSVLNDGHNWPPIYRKTLTGSQQEATGAATRRDRSFVFSRDYMYQLHDEYRDTDPDGRMPNPVQLIPIANKVGALSGDAIGEDGENGLYVPGLESIFVTEGAIHRKMTRSVDSDGSAGESWTWPDSWDISRPDDFFGFNDEKRNCYVLVGPSRDDSTRNDALIVFYEHVQFDQYGRPIMVPEHTRVQGVQLNCATEVINPTTGDREVWAGTLSGHLVRFHSGLTHLVDYDDYTVDQKYGCVMAAFTGTTVRVEGDFTEAPNDAMRGAWMRFYRGGAEVGKGIVTHTVRSDSWVDVTLDRAHGALGGDFWTVGAVPMLWKSGEDDGGSPLSEFRVSRVDLRFHNGNG